MYMIKVAKNPNFPQFLEIWSGLKLVKEVRGKIKALRIASKLAKEQGESYFLFQDQVGRTDIISVC
jgi:hypothetical protein